MTAFERGRAGRRTGSRTRRGGRRPPCARARHAPGHRAAPTARGPVDRACRSSSPVPRPGCAPALRSQASTRRRSSPTYESRHLRPARCCAGAGVIIQRQGGGARSILARRAALVTGVIAGHRPGRRHSAGAEGIRVAGCFSHQARPPPRPTWTRRRSVCVRTIATCDVSDLSARRGLRRGDRGRDRPGRRAGQQRRDHPRQPTGARRPKTGRTCWPPTSAARGTSAVPWPSGS